MGIVDSNGTEVVKYSYDVWGLPMFATEGSMTGTLGKANPFRYRGYVYDEETGLYYLRSRYYNPEWGRFLNADALINIYSLLFGLNVYVYCDNNPVCNRDEDGQITWQGEIHKAVQEEIMRTHPGMFRMETRVVCSNGKIGRIDLCNPRTGEIWEIKPLTWRKGALLNKTLNQFNSYLQGDVSAPILPDPLRISKLKPGGNLGSSVFMHTGRDGKSYMVAYASMGGGLIYYSYMEMDALPKLEESHQLVPAVAPAVSPVSMPVQGPNPSDLGYSFNEFLWDVACIGGYLIIAVLTGGSVVPA